MKNYYVTFENLVINCLIEINKKTGRRIIDMKDIYRYEEILNSFAKDENYNFVSTFSMDNLSEKFNKFVSLEHSPKPNFVMLPWIDVNDLIMNFRNQMSRDIIKIFDNKDINILVDSNEVIRLKQLKFIEKKITRKKIKESKQKINEYNYLLMGENKKIELTRNIKMKQKIKKNHK